MLDFIKEKTVNIATFSLLSLTSLTITTPSWGAAIDFSNNGWNSIGNFATPAQSQINLQSGTGNSLTNYIDNLEFFSGITYGGLDAATRLNSAYGSATTYNAKAGDSISFQFNFTQDESDFAFIKYNGQIQILNAGSSTFNTTFNSDQLFAFGVVDVDDSIGTSTLQVTGATYQPVPEPISILGSLTACGFGAVIRRRFGKKS